MSLLDSGPGYEPIIVFPEIMEHDEDGNPRTRPSTTGIPAKARFQFTGQSGTAARRAEQDVEGYESEKIYSMKLPREWTAQHGILGAQSEIEWRGARWALFGDARIYNGSPRIAHVEYIVSRS